MPEDLNFFKGISFFAITEHTKGIKKELLIEFQARVIKNIIAKAKVFNKLNNDILVCKIEIDHLARELDQLKKALDLLSREYKFPQN